MVVSREFLFEQSVHPKLTAALHRGAFAPWCSIGRHVPQTAPDTSGSLFFSVCSPRVGLRSPRRRRQVLAPLFPYLYFRVIPDPTRALPPCAQFWRPRTARALTRRRPLCADRSTRALAVGAPAPPRSSPAPRIPSPPMTTLARGRISCCSTPRSARCAGWGLAASRRIARRRFRRRPRRRRRRRPRRRRRRPSPHLRLAAARRARRAPPAASAGTSIDGGHPHAPSPPSHSFLARAPGRGCPLKEPTGCPPSAPAVPAAPAVDLAGAGSRISDVAQD